MDIDQWDKRHGGNPVVIDNRAYLPSGASRTGSMLCEPPTNPVIRLRRQVSYWDERTRRINLDLAQLRAALDGRADRFSWDRRCEEAYGAVQTSTEALQLLTKLSAHANKEYARVQAEYNCLTKPQPIVTKREYANSNTGLMEKYAEKTTEGNGE